MNAIHDQNKAIINKLQKVLYDIEPAALSGQLQEFFTPDAEIHLAYPFHNIDGPQDLYQRVFGPLITALPDLERRNFILMAGPSVNASNWVGCAGHYVGVFEKPWLDIPPTFHPVAMRYHEFFRVEDGKIVEMQALWDIPQLMMQARAWPLSPSLGVEWMVPAPAPQNGILSGPRNDEESVASQKLVGDMLSGLQKHAEGGPEAMNLTAYWHPKMTWYGPAGIGTNRRISGFRNWHQIPFLKGMPDRGMYPGAAHYFFADGPFVGFTAWPGMRCTISDDGWLGIAPVNQEISMLSLDFWRCENGLIRENWVLVDLLDVYNQIGVDVFNRMREYTVARQAKRPLI